MAQQRLKALEKGDEMHFWDQENPRCPHCGKDCEAARYEDKSLLEDGGHDIECLHCGLPFTVNTHVQRRFDTNEQQEGNK